jgi:hypothetical protein
LPFVGLSGTFSPTAIISACRIALQAYCTDLISSQGFQAAAGWQIQGISL